MIQAIKNFFKNLSLEYEGHAFTDGRDDKEYFVYSDRKGNTYIKSSRWANKEHKG